MTPTTIALIAIPSAAALAWMWWEVVHAPLIEDDNAVPDEEREARRVCETPEQRLRRITKYER